MATAREMIADLLAEAGIEFVFGLPGGGTVGIFDALFDKRDRVRSVLARHEQGAAIMADAYGRATGRPAVIMGQGAFMGSNASFGIMEAYMSSSPMVIITDTSDSGMAQHPANQSVTGEHGSPDLMNILRSMTKYTTLATTPKEAVLGVQLAIKHATSGRPGPAAVVLRSSTIDGEVDLESPPFIHPIQGYLNTAPSVARTEDIERVVQLLANAKSPLMVVGNGVHLADAHPQVQKLAEMLGMPVASTYKGKSAIAETHPLAVGMMGIYGQRCAHVMLGEADVVLVVGAKLTPQDTLNETPTVFDPRRQKIVQIDIDPRNAGWTFPIDIGLVGDAREILNQIIEAGRDVLDRNAGATLERVQKVEQRKRHLAYYEDPSMLSDDLPILPQRLVRILQETVDLTTLFTLDAGNNRLWMSRYYQVQMAKTFFAPGGLAGMGWALPAALALKMAFPNRPVVGVTGDGGFMMTVHAITTAVYYQVPVVYVVFNDSSLGMVRQHQRDRVIAAEFGGVDHGSIARALGAYGVQVSDPKALPDALREAIDSGIPAVVDVIINRETTFPTWG